MKNIIDTITNSDKEINEGFFDNVLNFPTKVYSNAFKLFDEFINTNKDRVVTLKGKDYLVYDFQLFGIDEMRDTIKKYTDPKYKGNQDIEEVVGGGYKIPISFNFSLGQSEFKNDLERGKGFIFAQANLYSTGGHLINQTSKCLFMPCITHFHRKNRAELLQAGAITAGHIIHDNDKYIADFYRKVLR